MRSKIILLALFGLLVSLLAGCLAGRQVEIGDGEYAPVRGAVPLGLFSDVAPLVVDRENRIAWFAFSDGSQAVIPFDPLPRADWPAGCPANIYSTRMEVLQIETEDLTVGSTTFHRPILVRDCPADPEKIALRSDGAIGGSGTACGGAEGCISFEVASEIRSLPRSMKGYELYSWYVDEKGAWHYTLITGTNRDKSFAEISAPQNVVTEHDWVKITVEGKGALKSVLDRLPEGETVFWNSMRRLEGAPALGDAYPKSAVVRELERTCRRHGVLLNVGD